MRCIGLMVGHTFPKLFILSLWKTKMYWALRTFIKKLSDKIKLNTHSIQSPRCLSIFTAYQFVVFFYF